MNRTEAYTTLARIIRAKNKGFGGVPAICLSIFYWTGNYSTALKYFNMLKNSNTIEVFCWKGVFYYFSKDFKSAQCFFENARMLDKSSLEVNYFLAETYFSMCEIEKAEAFYRSLISDPVFAVLGLYGTGCCLVELKRFDEAISFFNRVLPLGKDKYLINALNKKGLCLINQQQIEEAIKCLDKCLKLSPCNFSVKQNLALALSKVGNYERAVLLYKDVLTKYQYDIITINNLALSTASLGNYHEALELCNRGLLIDPLNADLLINKGYCLYKLNEFKNALNCITEAEKTVKDDVILQNNKALCLSALEEYEEAIKIFDKLLLRYKSDDIFFNRAFCLFKMGLYTEALDTLEKIEHKDGKKLDIYTIQSACYEKLGDNDKAIELLNKALIA